MISIIAKFTVNEGEEQNFLALTKDLIQASQAEAGCIEYDLHKNIKEARTYCMIEKWKDQDAVDFHNNTPHFTSAVPKIVEIAQAEIDLYKTL
ncbi:putative quinol monooxygenase [uncultured Draconibacterium sp.]|uniref:putative quinol monooxygenase n=1 Tax=uncultured Draconibacterium sp. TaxID=1573823 RepID=UPI003216CAE7